MAERTEGNFRGHNGIELFFQTWRSKTPRGTLVVTHGLGEHSECYNLFAQAMADHGWDVFAWDLRGHGRSEGKRGFVSEFNDYILDFKRFIAELQSAKRFEGRPFVLVGHSMGGLITLRTLIEHGPQGAKAVCLSSPLLGVALEVPKIKDLAARALFKLLPSVTLHNEILYEDLSRDKEVLKGYPVDALRHDKISPGLYLGILDSSAYVMENGDKIQVPVLLQVSGIDRIVSREKSEALYDMLRCKGKKLIVYDESFHEIFNDLDRKTVFLDLHAFLEQTVLD